MVKERHTQNISKRLFCLEKGFLFKDAPFMGYSEMISSIVEKHRWQIFYLHPMMFLPRDKAIKKSLQKNFTRPMPTFPIFPTKFLLVPNDDDEDDEEVDKKTIEQEKEVEKTESVHLEANKDKADVTQATTPPNYCTYDRTRTCYSSIN
ncbi:hypothetical protein J1N35_044025 [Gossypium stocksii]|uniref:Uncharacterized protein n=1 Tax=Gossypium stocksii TaxID=47602 RepID=A0A9D3ZFL8_9ROSI|nr:hypothetical protein J1N35_044025 [Gossypium stocksii]